MLISTPEILACIHDRFSSPIYFFSRAAGSVAGRITSCRKWYSGPCLLKLLFPPVLSQLSLFPESRFLIDRSAMSLIVNAMGTDAPCNRLTSTPVLLDGLYSNQNDRISSPSI